MKMWHRPEEAHRRGEWGSMCETIDTRFRRSRRSSTGCLEERLPGRQSVMEDLGPAWVLTGTISECQHAGTGHASPPPHGPRSPSERNDCICGSALSGTWILAELATNLWTQVSEKSDLTDVVFVFNNGDCVGLHKRCGDNTGDGIAS